jgi:hypothetical protein
VTDVIKGIDRPSPGNATVNKIRVPSAVPAETVNEKYYTFRLSLRQPRLMENLFSPEAGKIAGIVLYVVLHFIPLCI